MLCCLVGALLAAALGRSARRRRVHNPLLALLFGFGAGALGVELLITALVPLGVIRVPGTLAARLALLLVPATLAIVAGLAGAGGSVVNRQGALAVTAAAAAGAVLVEDLDLHVQRLHSAGGFAAAAVHAPAFLIVAAGWWWRSNLQEPGADPSLTCGREADVSRGIRPI